MIPRDKAAEAPGGATEAPSWQRIHDALHEAIIRHRLDPGAKIGEEEVAELFGVSRTIVRAALQALSRQGVVVVERNKGARVAQPTPDEARGIFEARELIEPRLASLAATRTTPADAERLRASLAAEHEALRLDRPRDALFLSADFHRIVAELSGHAVLAAILTDLLSRSSLVIALYWRQPEAICENHAHHGLLDALVAGDGALAGRLMRRHIAELLAGLDLTERPFRRSSIADALTVA